MNTGKSFCYWSLSRHHVNNQPVSTGSLTASISVCIIAGMQPAIFLDRDGVIIENRPDYVRHWEDVHFYPHALQALAGIRNSPYKIVIVTNQSAVGRGMISLETAIEINQRVIETIAEHGGRIDGSFICPHTPQDDCDCRKPKPGLFHQAAKALSLDLGQSYLIGDALSDLLAGQAAGLRQTVLVRTGRGAAQESLSRPKELKSFLTFETLSEALAALLQNG
jgi:D-glycero-D-manno-heptose 1,7-bisphosphate phosphatase